MLQNNTLGLNARDLNCFIAPDVCLQPLGEGPLSGLSFAAKDLFDVDGRVSGCGNPTWSATHTPAKATAPIIQMLLEQGAALRGMTQMNELAFGLDGENIHYGMPINPNYPDLIPGGSSGGSASAAAAGVVDFSLGTDTGGSVRVPASCCGIFGVRPTHGLLPLEGAMPLSQSFDVAGWFSADPDIFKTVADILLPTDSYRFNTVVLVDDAYAMMGEDLRAAFDRVFMAVASRMGKNARVVLSESGMDRWLDVFRYVQSFEVWRNHGEWFTKHNPRMSDEIAERMRWSATVDEATYNQYLKQKHTLASMVSDALADDAVFILPTVPGPVPLRSQSHKELEKFRLRTFKATCIAGVSGAPQVTVPCGGASAPFGVSLIGPRNSDSSLVKLALSISSSLKA